MAMQPVPFALQNASHPAAVFRQATSGMFASGGILAAGELTLSAQATPNMSVLLGAGRAKVTGNSVSAPSGVSFTTQAMYDTLNDAPLSITVSASNPTNPRIDAVYDGVQDSFYSGSTNTAVVGIVAGTPAASPSAPAIPTNSILIGYIAVAANTTTIVAANISYQATQAALINTPPTFATIAARTAFFAAPVIGQSCYMATAPLVLMEYSGVNWQRRGYVKPTATAVNAGTVTVNDDGSMSVVGVTTLDIQCFDANSQNYELVADLPTTAGSADILIQFGNYSGGTFTPVTGSIYHFEKQLWTAGTGSLNGSVTGTSFNTGRLNAASGNGQGGGFYARLLAPFLLRNTRVFGQFADGSISGGFEGALLDNLSHDSIRINFAVAVSGDITIATKGKA